MANGELQPSRRDWLLGAGAAGLLGGMLAGAPGPAMAQANGWDALVGKLLGTARPGEGKLVLDIPEIAENGNTVPFSITVDSPMSEADHVKALHVLATANPQPLIASYAFTPASGKAAVSSRLRLSGTQQLVVLAELSDNRFVMARREVKVTIGGCGG